ncbi:extracellular solute-binding protein [Schleiferilactobacillus shenzhenensis]|uniref:Uncharacterized protein n=1 Tax=Schleiferilactobacillus shenzhenensis LY-73 TaxID=1231336 RepID=U4TFX1_9LACO|nr:extracellular solute-binding protein [Schleiferilactobacillus shenzhenensis]ERL63661.1 hypothetical protein L248_2466 [Schleiferilactobacillus shenzhenensis LY-73]
MKKLFILIAAVLGVTVLSSCGTAQAYQPDIHVHTKDVTLKLWVDLNQGTYYRKVVQDFEKAHPDKNYHITVLESESGQASTNVQKDPEAAADVFITPNDRLGQLVEAGAVYQLTKYTSGIKANNTPTAVRAATYKGKMYGFPTTAESMFLVYDKRKFSAADVTSFAKLTAKGKLGINLQEAGADYRETPWFISNGSYLYGKNGEDPYGTTFNSAKGVQVLTWLGKLQHNKNVVPVNADEISAMQSGKINAALTGTWNAPTYKQMLGKNMGVTVYPTADFGSGAVPMKAFEGSNLYCVNAFTKYPLDAMQLANYLTSPKVQVGAFQALGKIPSALAARRDPAVTKDPVAKAVIAMTTAKHSVLMPEIPEMNVFWQHMNAVLVDVYNGKIQPAQYQATLDKFVHDVTPQKK